MSLKKIIVFLSLPLLCLILLSSQSLVDIAKKEKERRASLKHKSSKVVTNADLARQKRAPALTVVRAHIPQTKSPASPKVPAPQRPRRVPQGIDRESRITPDDIEERQKKADVYVELLTLKINGLWQKFYSFRDWTLRDEIQREMAETFQKLQKAKKDAEKIKKELAKRR